jgi:TrmH family RNA methyltransferase
MMRTVTRIDSPQNPRIAAAVALRDRRGRLATGQTIVDGARECRRALDARVAVDGAFVCPPLLRSADAIAAAAMLPSLNAVATEVSERVFEKLAFGARADGIVLVVRTPPTELADLDAGADPLILVTEDVEKPGNLGAILRTADATGCSAVIAIGGTDLFNPNVVRASIGIVFAMPLAAATAGEALAWLRSRGIRIVSARVDADRAYWDADLRGPLALVLGSEALGLSDAWSAPGIEGVGLPMLGMADSLNVSATAAVLAYEARRQRSAA